MQITTILALIGLFFHAADDVRANHAAFELAGQKMALDSITSEELSSHVHVLADDSLEGRRAGTRGGYTAGNYSARVFSTHLEPGAERDYFQTFQPNYRNVLGILRGSDPELQNEWIVIGAHYDHVGYGTRKTSRGPLGLIHNGADDNASGTAAILELIDAFSKSRPVRRSVLFALWDGEELGLLGSEHWVQHPTIPLDRIRCCINIDMIGRLRDQPIQVLGSRSMAGLRPLVALANSGSDRDLSFPWKVEENSDHFNFFDKDIPFLMFHSGLHDDYHRPTDDVEYLDMEGIRAITRLIFKSAVMLANERELGEFRSAARFESARDQQEYEQALPPPPGRLGISWKVMQDGLTVQTVRAGSAADQAGLLPGDLLVGLNGAPMLSSSTLQQEAVRSQRIGLSVQRPGTATPTTLDVQLGGEPAKVGISWRHSPAAPRIVTVVRVLAHSRAHLAGLRVGDRIYQVNGQKIESSKQFGQLLTDVELPATLLVERAGRLRETLLGDD